MQGTCKEGLAQFNRHRLLNIETLGKIPYRLSQAKARAHPVCFFFLGGGDPDYAVVYGIVFLRLILFYSAI